MAASLRKYTPIRSVMESAATCSGLATTKGLLSISSKTSHTAINLLIVPKRTKLNSQTIPMNCRPKLNIKRFERSSIKILETLKYILIQDAA